MRRLVGVVPRSGVPGGSGEAAEGPESRVVTVFSTKGGAGKSVIAANLAVTLAQSAKAPVVLVDADLQFGDLAVMLKLTPQHTIVDAVGSIDQLDAQLLNSILIRHSSGVLLLPAPLEPAVADEVSEVEKTLGVKADVLLPSDIIIPQSVNKGVPAVMDAPKSRFTKGIEQLAELFPAHVDVRSGH